MAQWIAGRTIPKSGARGGAMHQGQFALFRCTFLGLDFRWQSGITRREGTSMNRLIDAFEGLFTAATLSGGELAETADFTLETDLLRLFRTVRKSL